MHTHSVYFIVSQPGKIRHPIHCFDGGLQFCISCGTLFLDALRKKVEPAFHRLHPESTLLFTE